MISRSFAFSLAILALTTTGFAQEKFEISPFVGVRTAGSFRNVDNQLITFDISSAPTFGTFADFHLAGNAYLEFLWSHASGNVVQKEANIKDPQNPKKTDLFDVSVDYFHGGILYGGGNEKWEPYVAFGLGVSRFNPDSSGAMNRTKFSFSVGGGLKVHFSDRVGFRFDARGFGTRAGQQEEDIACGVFGCVSFNRASTFWQSQFVGAVVIGL